MILDFGLFKITITAAPTLEWLVHRWWHYKRLYRRYLPDRWAFRCDLCNGPVTVVGTPEDKFIAGCENCSYTLGWGWLSTALTQEEAAAHWKRSGGDGFEGKSASDPVHLGRRGNQLEEKVRKRHEYWQTIINHWCRLCHPACTWLPFCDRTSTYSLPSFSLWY